MSKAIRVLMLFLLFSFSSCLTVQNRSVSNRGGDLEAGGPVKQGGAGSLNVPEGKTWAVFIAIDRYQNWQKLDNPVKDAREIQKVLREYYEINEWRELFDDMAGIGGIRALFEQLQNEVGKNDSVFVFHAGHGFKDDKTEKGAWIPADAGSDRIRRDGWIGHDEIRIYLDKLPARHVFLISDSCYSGDLLTIGKGADSQPNRNRQKAYDIMSRLVVTSGASEEVPDSSEFAQRLKDTFERAKGDNINPHEIYSEVMQIQATYPQYGIMPGSRHRQGGSFLFFRKQAIPAITAGFDINGGSGVTPSGLTANVGSGITLPDADGFSKTGYTFGGWNSNANGTGTNYNVGSSYTPSGNITLYAKWTLNRYTVSFNANGGMSAPARQTVDHSGKVTLPSAMTKQSHTFDGWYREEACINIWNFNTDTVTADTVLYAKWTLEAVVDPLVTVVPVVPAPDPSFPAREMEPQVTDPDAAYLRTLGISVGSCFIAQPRFIGTIYGTLAPFRNSFLKIGLDLGLGSEEADAGYYSLYPFAHYALFLPFPEKGGWYAGGGFGIMASRYSFPEGDVAVNTFALDLSTGFNIGNVFDISYTLRTNFKTANSKIAVGYTYRFK